MSAARATGRATVARQAAQAQHLGDVRERGERGEQIVGLEHEADVVATQVRLLRLGQRGQAVAADIDDAGGQADRPGEEWNQGGLARARRAGEQHELASRDCEMHIVEDSRRECGLAVDHADAARGDRVSAHLNTFAASSL